MPVPSSIDDLSTTIGSNSPAGSETPGEGDNYIRSLSAFIASLRDKLDGTSAATLNGAEFQGTHTFTSGNLIAGTYTPTATAVTNCSITLVQIAQYMRVGNTVTVSGFVVITPTTPGYCTFGMSLPIASALSAFNQVAGSGASSETTPSLVYVSGDTVNDRAQMSFNGASASSKVLSYNYTYLVV